MKVIWVGKGKRLGWALLWCFAGCVSREELALRFRAQLQGKPFSCSERYLAGANGVLTLSDLRLYVSDIALVTRAGIRVPVTLTPDGRFQNERVALLDFEDKTGACTGGTRATHTVLKGSAPKGDYNAVELTLGLPFADNHQDMSIAKPPFDVSHMFWVWRDGYKFLRLDGRTDDATGSHPFAIHVGSTGCVSGAVIAAPARCKHPNRPRFRLPMAPLRDAIELDLGALLAGNASHGCESDPDDRDCDPVWRALGLAGTPATLLRVVRERAAP